MGKASKTSDPNLFVKPETETVPFIGVMQRCCNGIDTHERWCPAYLLQIEALADSLKRQLEEATTQPCQPDPDTVRLDALFATRAWRSPLIRFSNRLQVDMALLAGNPDSVGYANYIKAMRLGEETRIAGRKVDVDERQKERGE
jgi:hypothetical protein